LVNYSVAQSINKMSFRVFNRLLINCNWIRVTFSNTKVRYKLILWIIYNWMCQRLAINRKNEDSSCFWHNISLNHFDSLLLLVFSTTYFLVIGSDTIEHKSQTKWCHLSCNSLIIQITSGKVNEKKIKNFQKYFLTFSLLLDFLKVYT
jgi:hypothetical protein